MSAELADDAVPEVEVDQGAAPEAPVDTRYLIRNAVKSQREGGEEAKPAPVAKPASQQSESERQRDDAGRFAPAEPEKPGVAKPAQQQHQDRAQPSAPVAVAPQQGADDTPRAPGSLAPAARIAFDTAPPELRAAIAKRETEVNQGFAKYAGLDQFVKMAEQSGTNVDQGDCAADGLEPQPCPRRPARRRSRRVPVPRHDPRPFPAWANAGMTSAASRRRQ